MDDEIYKENLLDHYRNPHNFGTLKSATFSNKEFNPVCGDEIEIFVKFNKSEVAEDVKFLGKGCAISQASASMLTDYIIGKSKKELKEITKEDILRILGIKVGVVRMKCAVLSLKALHKGIKDYEKISD